MGHVHADRSEDERRGLVRRTQLALLAMRLGDDAGALDELTWAESGERGEARELMLLLFGACSELVATLGDGGTAPVKVQVFDETGEEVSIDEADPPVRTAVRTLLAQVHGNQEAAQEQVEIAMANAAPDEVDSLLLQALRWTARLSAECLERGLPVPDWIADTPTG
ncbi:hypothetical protein FHU38_001145 [Saccharomonospora amisosensis]|uniref:Uncharacterized protein n=1 Tax=Saccharomonospora amisosensis TaxID=1128677 RepID=A0A7X5UML7_9PSEU|nr:hypothetical protein [Saccharomonospora amisosensis]NIJ10801.1 hypothetical protein [Saccharomonospora amisosensis]